MSGIEVVGILLGAVPLVISALEHYKDGIDVISDIRHYRSTLKSLKTKLSIQEELYRGTIQRLLLSELSSLEIQTLFLEPGMTRSSSLWGDTSIEDKLRRKLGAKFDVFMNVVVDMNSIMEKLMEKLDIDMDGKPRWKPKSSTDGRLHDRFAWEWRRIRRSFGKAEREDLISSFERYNNNLASFVQNTEILTSRFNGGGKMFVEYLDLMRSQACELHSILGNSWRCSCNTPHKAYLLLQHPSEVSPSTPKFVVAFPSHTVSMTGPETSHEQVSALWNYTSVSISRFEDRSVFSRAMTESVLSAPTPQCQTAPITAKLSTSLKITREKKSSRVQFITPSKTGTSAATVVSLESPTGVACLKTNVPAMTPSLCDALCAARPAKTALGRFFNASADQVAVMTTDTSQEPSELSCLKMLLSKGRSPPGVHQNLSDKDRLKIALTLSSTVLQLYDSPWIGNLWSGQDVEFLSSKSAKNYEASISGPFVSTLFNATSRVPELQLQQAASNSSSLVDSLVPSKVLFALAVMLVELCLDQTLVDMRQLGLGKEVTESKTTLLDDYEMAHSQLNAVYQRSGSNYGDVVQRCLKCEFNITPKQKRLDFEKFRHLVYEGVVAPLEENYKRYLLYRGDT